MRIRNKKLCALLLAGVCCFTILNGCGDKEAAGENESLGNAPTEEVGEDSGTDSANIGEFSTQDITGETYTQEIFKDYDLTMVNVFTTWCTPCINEIPDLQKLSEEMADKGVNVVGIALDCVDGSGSPDNDTVEKAKMLAEYTGASYPFLIPDESFLNGRLIILYMFPAFLSQHLKSYS